ncbi:hypothetical protein [Phaeacidiphilus oryzae]|uniref:hypothetical protein n=1 Tax=Phaeacidiphilus oryzae TaxID=348818 RepID=UPI00056D341A|nr:hypothetical protein [Phaeacidiphilus oryzae]
MTEETMHAVATPLELVRALAMGYRAALERERAEAEEAAAQRERDRREGEIAMAVYEADEQVDMWFPNLLAGALLREDWTGYPSMGPLPRPGQGAGCAVAHLGEGLWLLREQAGARELPGLRLLVPCACEGFYECDRYHEIEIGEDRELLAALTRIESGACLRYFAPDPL